MDGWMDGWKDGWMEGWMNNDDNGPKISNRTPNLFGWFLRIPANARINGSWLRESERARPLVVQTPGQELFNGCVVVMSSSSSSSKEGVRLWPWSSFAGFVASAWFLNSSFMMSRGIDCFTKDTLYLPTMSRGSQLPT